MDRDGFDLTLRDHGDGIYSYAVWLLSDAEEARDVVQEAFMRLWTRRAAIAEAAGRAWLMRVVHRLCLDRFRRRRVRREVNLDAASGTAAAPGSGAEEHLELSELQVAIYRALARMAPRDRALIVMREIQNLSHQEMARVLDMRINTLKPALHRARERLRRDLSSAGVCP